MFRLQEFCELFGPTVAVQERISRRPSKDDYPFIVDVLTVADETWDELVRRLYGHGRRLILPVCITKNGVEREKK